jgi:hypothetical protein
MLMSTSWYSKPNNHNNTDLFLQRWSEPVSSFVFLHLHRYHTDNDVASAHVSDRFTLTPLHRLDLSISRQTALCGLGRRCVWTVMQHIAQWYCDYEQWKVLGEGQEEL